MEELGVEEAVSLALKTESIARAEQELYRLYRCRSIVYGRVPCTDGDFPAFMIDLKNMGIAELAPFCCDYHALKGGSCESRSSIFSVHGLCDRMASKLSVLKVPEPGVPMRRLRVARLTPLGRVVLTLCYSHLGLKIDEMEQTHSKKPKRCGIQKTSHHILMRCRSGLSALRDWLHADTMV